MSSSDSRSARDLQWPELCAAISTFAVSDTGRRLSRELAPTSDVETAQTRQAVLSEVMDLAESGFILPAGDFSEVSDAVLRIERGAIASGVEFRRIGKCLSVALALDRFGQQHEDTAPLVSRMLAINPELQRFSRSLDLTIDDQGDVLDEASVELAHARREVRKIVAEIKSKMTELIARYREALQDGYFAERDGRYVLPVRTDAPYRVDGVVLGTSGSGSTLYVEPQELGKLGNRLRLSEGEVERQVAIVLGRLSAELLPLGQDVRWAEEVCGRADLLASCARFSQRISARVVPFDEPGRIDARGARHPLLCLQLDVVIPSDLSLAPDRALILSGPNAGGKTVALKTLGLLSMMQSTGLPVPVAAGSKIGFFDEVLCDIGDDQSLSMSLSTFSGHVARVVEILDDAGHGSLVLFDELMGGTDPDEGAVLAIATIEALVASGATVCVTTHYEALKEEARKSQRLENGAVGFDFERMEPTFVVSMGRPGASSALIVAGRFGLPRSITARAEALLPEKLAAERELRIATEQASAQLESERRELEKLRSEQEETLRRFRVEAQRERERQRKELVREGDALRAELKAARAEVRRVQTALKSAGRSEVNQLQSDLDRAARVDAFGGELHRNIRTTPVAKRQVDAARLTVGMRVEVAGFSAPGEVIELPKKGMVRVLLGVMKMNVALSDVVGFEGGSSSKKSDKSSTFSNQSKTATSIQSAVEYQLVKSEDITLDLRGQRVEDALLLVDQFIDELLRNHEQGGFVLHGHGTGALKEAVRTHLRAHACVSRTRPAERDEGGDAHTVFWLSL